MIKFKVHILPFVFFLTALTAFSQRPQKPKNISEALVILALECPDSVKAKISKTPNEALFNLCYPNGDDLTLIFDWFDVKNGNSRLEKYFAKNGIDYFDHMANVLLLAYKKTLLNEPYTESELLQPYQAIEYKWAQEDIVRFTTDSLRGQYIPKDLEDCFKQIDSFWSDSLRNEVKQWTEDDFTGRAHMGFGMWMRNNWQLWGGSRLSAYFNKMGIYHPDDMSGIILTSYHRYLRSAPIELEAQIKIYQDYWNKKSEVNEDKKLFRN